MLSGADETGGYGQMRLGDGVGGARSTVGSGQKLKPLHRRWKKSKILFPGYSSMLEAGVYGYFPSHQPPSLCTPGTGADDVECPLLSDHSMPC